MFICGDYLADPCLSLCLSQPGPPGAAGADGVSPPAQYSAQKVHSAQTLRYTHTGFIQICKDRIKGLLFTTTSYY